MDAAERAYQDYLSRIAYIVDETEERVRTETEQRVKKETEQKVKKENKEKIDKAIDELEKNGKKLFTLDEIRKQLKDKQDQ